MNVQDVQAVILAGGKGTRLRPVTADLPKPLVPIANRPLVVHQMAHFAQAGVTDVTLALGYAADRFRGVEAEADALGVRLRLLVEPEPLGTGGALRWCADQGAFDDRPLLCMNGDVVASPDVAALAELHERRSALVTFWLTSARDISQFGVLELDDDGAVRQFLEKPAPDETSSHLVNAGILMLNPKLLEQVPEGRFFSFERGLLPGLVRRGDPMYGLFDGGYWMDTGRPQHYLEANRHVCERRVDWSPAGELVEDGLWCGERVMCDGATVIKPAVLGDDVILDSGVQLFGRTVIGDSVTVHAGAGLEDCVLFDGVTVGEGAEIINSIVCAGARIGNEVVLRDAIIGARAQVGDGNELRGARLWNDTSLPSRTLFVE